MTFALVGVDNSTYGGIYYCSAFTTTGAITWSKLTTTGLPNVELKYMQVGVTDPRNRQYVTVEVAGLQEIYTRYVGNWSKVMDTAAAKTLCGETNANYKLKSLWADPTIDGRLWSALGYDTATFGATNYVIYSDDHGANWSVGGSLTLGSWGINTIQAIGNYVWLGCNSELQGYPWIYGSDDKGVTWFGLSGGTGGIANCSINVDRSDPSYCYTNSQGGDLNELRKVQHTGAALAHTVIGDFFSDRGEYREGQLWTDPDEAGRGILANEPDVQGAQWWTDDQWATYTDVQQVGGEQIDTVLGIQNEVGDDILATHRESATYIWYLSSETDTTPENRSGANADIAPYTDSVPTLNRPFYSLWFGEAPAESGVYVYADELGDITDIPSYAGLGIPLFGDRSSWRDLPADGFDLYHAEDVEAATPQIHAPWDDASPPPVGYGIISDGTKWEVSSDEIALVGDLHDPVTLDADAAVILDLNVQEIGLDVQNANTVFAGPTVAPANEPTFRALILADLPAIDLNDLDDVNTGGVGDGDALVYDSGTSTWIPGDAGVDTGTLHGHIINEDHSDDCDGATVGFGTAYDFLISTTAVYLNGLRQRLSIHYSEDLTLDGITFVNPPEAGDELVVDYIISYADWLLYLASLAEAILDSDSETLQDSDGILLSDSL